MKALLCRWLGHRWPDPGFVAVRSVYRAACDRCDLAVEGTWHDIERAGAWRHYRSSF